MENIRTTWRTYGLPLGFRDDLLAYAEIMRHDPAWRHRWHWNDDWLTPASVSYLPAWQLSHVLHDPHEVGTSMLNYRAWFTELEQNPSEVSPVFTLLTLCWNFHKTGGTPVAGPLKQHMSASNPYTIATDKIGVGDWLHKYRNTLLNTDDVPAKWADIPEGPQKWKLEELGRQLTNISGYAVVRWAESRGITLKGNEESVEHWWNRLWPASRIELWRFANYRMTVA